MLIRVEGFIPKSSLCEGASGAFPKVLNPNTNIQSPENKQGGSGTCQTVQGGTDEKNHCIKPVTGYDFIYVL